MYKISAIFLICAALLFSSCDAQSNINTPSGTSTITAPDNLQLDAVSGATLEPSIELDWSDNSDNEDGFNIERSMSADFSNAVTFSADADAVHYLDKGVTPEIPYYYRVCAYSGDDDSAWCEAEPITFYYPLPAAPSGATAARLNNTSCRVNWDDNSYCEMGFTIEYSLSEDFSVSATTTAGVDETGTTVEGLVSEDYYYIRVRSVNSTGSSDWTKYSGG